MKTTLRIVCTVYGVCTGGGLSLFPLMEKERTSGDIYVVVKNKDEKKGHYGSIKCGLEFIFVAINENLVSYLLEPHFISKKGVRLLI